MVGVRSRSSFCAVGSAVMAHPRRALARAVAVGWKRLARAGAVGRREEARGRSVMAGRMLGLAGPVGEA